MSEGLRAGTFFFYPIDSTLLMFDRFSRICKSGYNAGSFSYAENNFVFISFNLPEILSVPRRPF